MSQVRSSPSGPTEPSVAQYDEQRFSGPGTYSWVKPAGARSVTLYLFPVGSPGASGRNNGPIGTTNASGGGAGGSNGPFIYHDLPASLFPVVVPVVIGANSIGGPSIATPTTNGQAGTVGGTTSFGNITAPAGTSGSGGSTINAGGSATNGGQDFSTINGLSGGQGNNNTVGAAGQSPSNNALVSPAAGGGGGIPIAGTANNGGASGSNAPYPYPTAATGGLAAGVKNGADGANVSSPTEGLIPGQGGGGGASASDGTAAGNGGAGGFPSGGGGGGGASAGGGPSGAGGPGGGALVVAITRIEAST